MEPQTDGLTIDALAERVGLPVRTVRFYIAEGLLPGPGARGKGASYGEEHRLRLELIKRLSAQRYSLAEQRDALSTLTSDEVRSLLDAAEHRENELKRAAQAKSPLAYVSALLKRSREIRTETAPAAPMLGRDSMRTAAPPPSIPRPAAAPAAPLARPQPVPEGAHAESLADTHAAGAAWRRWTLARGVELHVQVEAEAPQRKLIARLLAVSDEAQRDREQEQQQEGTG